DGGDGGGRMGHLLIQNPADPLVDVLALEVWIDRLRRTAEQRGAARCSGRGQKVRRIGREVVAERRDLAAERPDVDVLRDVLVEPAVVRKDLRLACGEWIPDEADARG